MQKERESKSTERGLRNRGTPEDEDVLLLQAEEGTFEKMDKPMSDDDGLQADEQLIIDPIEVAEYMVPPDSQKEFSHDNDL